MQNKKFKKNLPFIVACSLLIASLLAVLFHYANLKIGYDTDEIFTFGLSNGFFNELFTSQYDKWHPSSDYFDFLTVNNTDKFRFDSVYYNQTQDVHPPLFYMIFHAISSFLPNTFSKWIGIGINIVFYLLICLVVYFLMNRLVKNKWVSLSAVAFWGGSMGAISSVMFIRMYTMLTFGTILFLYVAILFLKSEKIKLKDLLVIYVVSIVGILTQYYFLIAAFFISFLLCIFLAVLKKWKAIAAFTVTMFGSIASSVMLYPAMLKHIFASYRGKEAFSSVASDSPDQLSKYLNIINNSFFGGMGGYLFACVALLIVAAAVSYALRNNAKESAADKLAVAVTGWFGPAILMIVPALLHILVIQKISPFQSGRYVYCVFPALMSGIIFLVYISAKQLVQNERFACLLIAAFCLMTTYFGFRNGYVEYLLPEQKTTSNLVQEYSDNDVFLIINEDAEWRIIESIAELINFKNIYPYSTNPSDIILPNEEKLMNESSLIVYIDTSFDQKIMIEKIMNTYGFTGYKQLYYSGNAYEIIGYSFNK
jgi:hypothetical protein